MAESVPDRSQFCECSQICHRWSARLRLRRWYVLLFIAVGVPATVMSAGLTTGAQQQAEPRMRGRLLSLLAVADSLGHGTGIVVAGVLSSVVPLSVLLNVQAGCYALCAAVIWLAFHPLAHPREGGL